MDALRCLFFFYHTQGVFPYKADDDNAVLDLTSKVRRVASGKHFLLGSGQPWSAACFGGVFRRFSNCRPLSFQPNILGHCYSSHPHQFLTARRSSKVGQTLRSMRTVHSQALGRSTSTTASSEGRCARVFADQRRSTSSISYAAKGRVVSCWRDIGH